MRVGRFVELPPPPKEYDPEYFTRFMQMLALFYSEYGRVVDGALGFGDGVDTDNMMGKWVSYTTNGVANTEDTVTHSLGSIPIGFLVMVPPQSGFLYTGPTAWTTSALYLKCSAASQAVRIFVLAPSQGTIT